MGNTPAAPITVVRNKSILWEDSKTISILPSQESNDSIINQLNEINDIEKLKLAITLPNFDTAMNRLTNLKILSMSKNDGLYIEHSIRSLPQLTILSVSSMVNIQTFNPSYHNNLIELYITNNNLTKLTNLHNLPNLKVLDCSWNKLECFNDFSELSSIEILNASGNLFQDYSGLECLTSLKELHISNSESAKIIPSTIGYLKNLEYFNIGRTTIKKFPIEMTELKYLRKIDLLCNITPYSGYKVLNLCKDGVDFNLLDKIYSSDRLLKHNVYKEIQPTFDLSSLVYLDDVKLSGWQFHKQNEQWDITYSIEFRKAETATISNEFKSIRTDYDELVCGLNGSVFYLPHPLWFVVGIGNNPGITIENYYNFSPHHFIIDKNSRLWYFNDNPGIMFRIIHRDTININNTFKRIECIPQINKIITFPFNSNIVYFLDLDDNCWMYKLGTDTPSKLCYPPSMSISIASRRLLIDYEGLLWDYTMPQHVCISNISNIPNGRFIYEDENTRIFYYIDENGDTWMNDMDYKKSIPNHDESIIEWTKLPISDVIFITRLSTRLYFITKCGDLYSCNSRYANWKTEKHFTFISNMNLPSFSSAKSARK